jgi:methyl-accepting chemotaxis protein
MFNHLKIGTKILFVTVTITVGVIAAIGVVSDISVRQSFEEESFKKLTAVREMKGQQIEEYFELISEQIRSLSRSKNVIDAIVDLKVGISILKPEQFSQTKNIINLYEYYQTEFGRRYLDNTGESLAPDTIRALIPESDISKHLQALYIVENNNEVGSKNDLMKAEDGSYYSTHHGKHHAYLNDYLSKFGFYDIFLIDSESGQIIYSVFKEVDFATSLLDGPYKDSNLAVAFKAARNAENVDFVKVVDFGRYIPSFGAPASFIASPH